MDKHKNCFYFEKHTNKYGESYGYCRLKHIVVDPEGNSCNYFTKK